MAGACNLLLKTYQYVSSGMVKPDKLGQNHHHHDDNDDDNNNNNSNNSNNQIKKKKQKQ